MPFDPLGDDARDWHGYYAGFGSRFIAYVLDAVVVVVSFYLILGLMGMFLTGWDFFSNVDGVELFGFTVNPLTNVIHLLVALVGIPMANDPIWARRYLMLIGVLGVPFSILGFLLDGSEVDYFATNGVLNVTHLAISVVALAIALWPARSVAWLMGDEAQPDTT